MITIIPSPFNSLNSLFPPQYFPFPSPPSTLLHPSIYLYICTWVVRHSTVQFRGRSKLAISRQNWQKRGPLIPSSCYSNIFSFVVFVSFRDLIKFLCLKKFGMDGIYIRDRDPLVERSSGWWPFDSKLRNSPFSTVMENFS